MPPIRKRAFGTLRLAGIRKRESVFWTRETRYDFRYTWPNASEHDLQRRTASVLASFVLIAFAALQALPGLPSGKYGTGTVQLKGPSLTAFGS